MERILSRFFGFKTFSLNSNANYLRQNMVEILPLIPDSRITWLVISCDAFLLRVRGQSAYKLMNIVPGTCTKNQTMVPALKRLVSYESFVLHPNDLNMFYQKIWQFQQDSHFATTKNNEIRAIRTSCISFYLCKNISNST